MNVYIYMYMCVWMYVSIHIDRKRKWNKDRRRETDICKGLFPELKKVQNDSKVESSLQLPCVPTVDTDL